MPSKSISKAALAMAAVSTFAFTTTFFKNPNDRDEPWIPHDGQIQLYDVVDYGYSTRHKKIKPPEPIEVVVMSWPRQNGKTEGTASTAGALAIRYAGAQIGIMSNTHINAKKLLDRIYVFIVNAGFKDLVKSKNKERISFVNGSNIDSFGQTEGIRGNSYWWLIIDEAAMFSDKMLENDAIPTTRTAGAFRKFGTPSVILLSTPRGTVGRFADMYMKGISERWVGCRECEKLYKHIDFKDLGINWFDFDVVRDVPKELPDCECGAHDYEYVDRYYSIVSINPYDLRSKEEIDKELERRGNTALAEQEILGKFIGSGANVFRREWLETCVNASLTNADKPIPGRKYYMGIDFGKAHDATVFCVCHKENGIIVFDWIDIMPGRGLEYSDIRKQMMDNISNWKPVWVIPDTTGMGNPVCEQLEKDIIKLRKEGLTVEYGKSPHTKTKHFPQVHKLPTKILSNKKGHYGFMFDMNSKPEVIDELSTVLQHGLIEIPPEQIYKVQIMWNELINFGYEYTDSGRIKYGIQTTHDDTVIALALACWGIRQKPFIFGRPKLGGKNLYVQKQDGSVQTDWSETSYSLGFR